MSELMEVTDRTFDAQVFKPDIPVLVDFRASWCVPCRDAEEMLAELARTYAGRLKVVWMDVDQNSQTTYHHRVSRVPTRVLFANGQEVARWEGAVTREQLMADLLQHIILE
jgi:thioredoxin 1